MCKGVVSEATLHVAECALKMCGTSNTGIVITTSQMVNQITHLTYRAAAEQLRSGRIDSTLPGPYGDVEVVQETIYNDLLERALDALAQVKIGHLLDANSQMGPLVHAGHKTHVATAVSYLKSRGGAIHQVTPCPTCPATSLRRR